MLLLVDDDPHFLQAAEEVLVTRDGIFLARSAEQAKDLMRSFGSDFSLAMVDLDLPGQDGFSLIEEMRLHFPDLPIIAISGVAQEGVLEIAKVLGAADALHKPITPDWQIAMARACTG